MAPSLSVSSFLFCPIVGISPLVWSESLLYVSYKPIWFFLFSLGIFFFFNKNKRWKDYFCFLFVLFGSDFGRLAWRKGGKGLCKSKSHKLISQNNSHIQNGWDAFLLISFFFFFLHCGFQPNHGVWNPLAGSQLALKEQISQTVEDNHKDNHILLLFIKAFFFIQILPLWC